MSCGQNETGTEISGGTNTLEDHTEKIEEDLREQIFYLFSFTPSNTSNLWNTLLVSNIFSQRTLERDEEIIAHILSLTNWVHPEFDLVKGKRRQQVSFLNSREKDLNFKFTDPELFMDQVLRFENICTDLQGIEKIASVDSFNLNGKICLNLSKFKDLEKDSRPGVLRSVLFHEMCHLTGVTSETLCNMVQKRIKNYHNISGNLIHGFSFAEDFERLSLDLIQITDAELRRIDTLNTNEIDTAELLARTQFISTFQPFHYHIHQSLETRYFNLGFIKKQKAQLALQYLDLALPHWEDLSSNYSDISSLEYKNKLSQLNEVLINSLRFMKPLIIDLIITHE